MSAFLFLAGLQGVAIIADEFLFHRKRGLPRWERIGHPIDTATVLTCLIFLGLAPRTPTNEHIYYALAIISCICITKDEWVHRKYCAAEEMWLHAVLFIAHPLLLFSALADWPAHQEYFFLVAGGVSIFFVYQIVYWNFIEYKLRERRNAAHYQKISNEELYDYFGE